MKNVIVVADWFMNQDEVSILDLSLNINIKLNPFTLMVNFIV